MRKAFAILALLAAALLGAPAAALAASTPTLELASWVRSSTDLAVSQIAIAGPENVYSLEPLGPRLPTGEVLALVRTEAVRDDWRDDHQFQSWDAHMLLDCQGGRVRVLRSASYPERDRIGPARADERGDAWFTPEASAPAATLLAAACDPAFSWPLRASPAAAPAKASPLGGPSMLQTAAASSPAREAITPVLIQTAFEVARAPVVRLADVQTSGPVLSAPVDTVETPPKVVTAVARAIAPVMARLEKAAAPNVSQFASNAAAEDANAPVQKASFTPGPALEAASAWPEEAAPARRPAVLTAAAAVTKTWKRLAGAGRSWLVRRVEVAFRQGEAPAQSERGPATQARTS